MLEAPDDREIILRWHLMLCEWGRANCGGGPRGFAAHGDPLPTPDADIVDLVERAILALKHHDWMSYEGVREYYRKGWYDEAVGDRTLGAWMRKTFRSAWSSMRDGMTDEQRARRMLDRCALWLDWYCTSYTNER